MAAFLPMWGQSQVLSATTGNKSIAVPQDALQFRIHVLASSADGVCIHMSTQPREDDTAPAVSTTTDMYIPVGATEIFTKSTAVTMGYKCPSGTATVYFTPGTGE